MLLSLLSSSSSSPLSSCDALRREQEMATVRVRGVEGRRDWMEAAAGSGSGSGSRVTE